MTFSSSRCYYFIKLFLSVIGQWPQQPQVQGNVMSAITVFFIASLTSLEFWGLVNGYTNITIVMDNTYPLLVNIFISVKMINHLYNKYKMNKLLSDIEETWERMQIGPENEILRYYAEEASVLIVRYADEEFILSLSIYIEAVKLFLKQIILGFYIVLIMVTIPPIAVSGIYSLLPINETFNVTFPYRLEHVINMDKYFNLLMLHTFISVFYGISAVIAIDSLFVVSIEHICALFEIIRYNLEHIESSDVVKSEQDVIDDETYSTIIDCIKFHKHALRLVSIQSGALKSFKCTTFEECQASLSSRLATSFFELLSSAYATSYLFIIANVTICLSFSAAELIIMDLKLDEIMKIVSVTGAEIAHLYYLSLTSQKLIDHSSGLHEAIYSCNWYMFSLRSKRLLRFMLLRAIKPCEIKAGKMYVMSMENFSSILKTSMSYFTVLTSMQ